MADSERHDLNAKRRLDGGFGSDTAPAEPEPADCLPSIQREVWALRAEGLSIPAIAKRLGEEEHTVRARLNRAMANLRRGDPLGRLQSPPR